MEDFYRKINDALNSEVAKNIRSQIIDNPKKKLKIHRLFTEDENKYDEYEIPEYDLYKHEYHLDYNEIKLELFNFYLSIQASINPEVKHLDNNYNLRNLIEEIEQPKIYNNLLSIAVKLRVLRLQKNKISKDSVEAIDVKECGVICSDLKKGGNNFVNLNFKDALDKIIHADYIFIHNENVILHGKYKKKNWEVIFNAYKFIDISCDYCI